MTRTPRGGYSGGKPGRVPMRPRSTGANENARAGVMDRAAPAGERHPEKRPPSLFDDALIGLALVLEHTAGRLRAYERRRRSP